MRRGVLLFLLAAPALASDVVVCDPADPAVADSVTAYRTSVDTPVYASNPDALINPDVAAVLGVEPLRYWKCDRPGNAAVAMSGAEKSAVDAQDAAALDAAVRAGARNRHQGFVDQALFLRAFADIVKDEINILRQWDASFKVEVAAANNLANLKARVAGLPDLPDRNLAQLRAAIDARIDSGGVD